MTKQSARNKVFLICIFILAFFGFLIFAQNQDFGSFSGISARYYAPNLWFDSEENYFPTNPLNFYFENNSEIPGEEAVKKYKNLSKTEKLKNSSVFYYEKDLGNEIVFEYWLFYVLNDFQNAHYGDWESIFVFIDKNTKNINKIIASAHGSGFELIKIDPMLRNSWAYIGNGSHAGCPDFKPDGICNFRWWNIKESWDASGEKLFYNDYELIKIDESFIKNFNNQKSFDKNKSPDLGINPSKILPFLGSNNQFYVDFPDLPLVGDPFGKTPTYAWVKEEYENPEKISPSSQQQYLIEVAENIFIEAPKEFFTNVGNFVSNTTNNIFSGVGGFFSGFRLFEASIEPIELSNQNDSLENENNSFSFPPENKNYPEIVETQNASSLDNDGQNNNQDGGTEDGESANLLEENQETLLPSPSLSPTPSLSPSPSPSISPDPSPSFSPTPTPTQDTASINTSLADILISEVCAGLDNSQNEFIELYNPTDQYVSISNENFKLKLVNSKNEITSKRIEWKTQSIPPKGYFLFVAGNVNGVSADANFSDQLTDVSGVIIVDGAGNIKDKLAWGKADKQPPQEAVSGSGLILEGGLNTDESLERKSKENSTWLSLARGGEDFGKGNGYDTNNNYQDFVLQSFPNPQNSKGEIKADSPPSQGYYSSGDSSQSGEKHIVSRIIDGDTVEISTGQRVRFIGINSPESDQCFFQQAKEINQQLLLGKEVRFEKDVSETDKYGRLLRYAYLDNIFINDYLVINGYAFRESISPDTKYKNLFSQSESYAKLGKLGLWGQSCAPTAEAGINKTVSINQPVNFDASDSTDNTKIIYYKWDVDTSDGLNWDSIASPDEEFSFSGYSTPGQYIVTLQVEDDSGNVSTDTLLVDVLPSPKILITEVQIAGGSSDNDFIELYNPTDSVRDISGFQLKKKNQSGTESSIKVFADESVISARGYFLWANSENGYGESIKADSLSGSYLTENNSIAILDNEKNVLDRVAWGKEHINPFVEIYAYPQNPTENQSLERRKDDNGSYIDLNDNSQDFFLQENPNPQGKNSDGQSENQEEGEPIIDIAPAILDFSSVFGSNPLPQIFNISNIGGGDLDWTTPIITEEWISLDALFGKISSGQSQKVEVSLNVFDKPVGDYSAKIIINSKEILVNLSVIEKTEEIFLADHLVINEVQAQKEEFVKVYNPTDQEVNLSGWTLSYNNSRDWKFPDIAKIAPKSFYFIGIFGYVGTDWDLKTQSGNLYKSGQFSNDSGSIAIINENNNTIDIVGWGDSEIKETNTAVVPEADQSIVRLWPGHDTDNNLKDFKVRDLDQNDFSKTPVLNPFIKALNLAKNSFDISWGLEIGSSEESLDYFNIEYSQDDKNSWEFWTEEKIAGIKKFDGAEDGKIYYFRIQAINFAGRASEWKEISVQFISSPILINEVAWSGDNKYIELFNKTGQEISLTGWSLKYFWHPTKAEGDEYFLVSFAENDKISPNGYFLYSGSALSDLGKNENQKLKLFNSADDYVDAVLINGKNDWKKGAAQDTAMERVSKFASGEYSKNWLESAGTPGERNSVDGLYTFLTGPISGTLKIEASPYIISSFCDINGVCGPNGGINILVGKWLIIEPGAVLEFENGGLSVDGTLLAEGTEEKPIVFTSIYDSDFGGVGVDEKNIWHYWRGINFNEQSSGSVLNHIKVKYTANVDYESRSYGIKAIKTSISLKNSVIENGSGPGLWLVNSDSIIENTKFIDLNKGIINDPRLRGEGALLICGKSPEVKNSYFQKNKIGIKVGFTIGDCAPNDAVAEIEDGDPIIEDNEFVENKDPIIVLSAKYIPIISGNYGNGNTNNGIKISGFISKNSTLYKNQDFPYIADGGFGVLGDDVILDISAGVSIYFLGDGNTFLASGGVLNILGTENEPVVFGACRDGDSCWGAEFWSGVVLDNLDENTEIKNLKIKHAGKKGGPAVWNLPVPSLKIINSRDIYLENVIIEDYVEKIVEIDSASTLKQGSTIFSAKNGETPVLYPL